MDRSEVPLNQKLTFTIQASWEGEQSRFSLTPILPPPCKNLEIFESSSLNESKIDEGKTKSLKTFQFILKPLQTGKGNIGSVQVKYVDNLTQDSSSLSTQPIRVQITPAIEGSRSGYKPALIIAIFLVLVYVIYSSRKKVKRIEILKEKEAEEIEQKSETPEEKALKNLVEISEQARKGMRDSFSRDIYRLLTGYLEARYQIVTSGKTTNDIVNALSNLDLSSERVTLLREILSSCDLIKFAKEGLAGERCDQILGMAKEFLEQKQ